MSKPCSMPCHKCIEKFDLKCPGVPTMSLSCGRMILCSECGCKRCPKASDHDLECTGSNEPGQPGSIYADFKVPDTAEKMWVDPQEGGDDEEQTPLDGKN